jgi:hypothetical protein
VPPLCQTGLRETPGDLAQTGHCPRGVDREVVELALGLTEYDPQRFAKAGVTWDEVMGYAEKVGAPVSS